MKRKLLMILTLTLVLFGTLGLASACKKDEETPRVAGEEAGEYYCDVNGVEYSLTLTEDCHYKLTLGGDPIEGTYAPDGEDLMFKEGEDYFIGSYFNNVVELSYHSNPYTFLRKIEYTITFDTDGGSTVDPIVVYNGRCAAEPKRPTKAQDAFIGWYTDKAFKNLYSFSEAVTSSFTLYARFVTPIKPEYTVTFDLNGATGTAPAPVQTVGHQVFGLPTPEWEGHDFVGWWVSHNGKAAELTYQYNEELLGGNTTFYAVWASETPAVSVGEKQITWSVQGSASNFTVVIKNRATNEELEREPIDGKTSFNFDFTKQEMGEYVIEVTAGNNTGRAYYRNKALDKVSVFEVRGSTLLFNPVTHATDYFVTIECGDPEGTHAELTRVEDRAFNFESCLSKDGKIIVTVTAQAEGYLSSTSDPYEITRTLAAPTDITVSDEAILSWTAVPNAASYDIVVKQGEDEVYSGNVPVADPAESNVTFSLKFLGAGTYTVSIMPKARGWISPATPGTYTYTKATLKTPTNIHADLANNKIVWDAVNGVSQYKVRIGTKEVTVSTNSIEFKAEYRVSGQDEYAVSVCALSDMGTANSPWSEDYTVRYNKLGGELRYSNGVLSWDPVFGVHDYTLTVNGAGTTSYTDVSSITLPPFAGAAKYTYKLSAGGVDISTDVTIWQITLTAPDSDEVPSLFLADGDAIHLPDGERVTRYGYTLDGWYTQENGGMLYTDSVYVESRNRTLYAHWSPLKFHVSLVVGSTGEQTQEIRDGVSAYFDQPVQLPVPESTDPAVVFFGWYDSAVGGTQITNYMGLMPKYLQATDITLYAQWMTVLAFTAVTSGGQVTGYSVSKSPDIVASAVTSITIPQEYKGVPVTKVEHFEDLTQLEVIHIPDSIQSIYTADKLHAFSGCSKLAEIDIYETDANVDKYYFSKDGVLFFNDPVANACKLLIYPVAKTADVYEIPDGVQYIPAYSLYGISNLRSISFPSSVTFIEAMAVGASYSCYIETITFRESSGGAADELTIQPKAFCNMSYIEHITLPARMKDFDFWTMFYSDYSSSFSYLETIEIVGTGKYSSQNNMILKQEATDVVLVFYPLRAETFSLPASVTKIGANAVQGNTKLKGITIPASISEIGEHAFDGDTNVESLTFMGRDGDYPLTIKAYAFYEVGSYYSHPLTELTLPSNCISIGEFAFGETEIDTVHIDFGTNMSGTLTIADSAFSSDSNYESTYNSTVETLYIGPGVRNVNFMSAFGSKLETIHLDKANPYYDMNDEETVLFVEGRTEIVWLTPTFTGEFVIPDTVTKIGTDNFKYRTGITKFTIPASVTSIGDEAFLGCSGLEGEGVVFTAPANGAERAELTIGNKAFYDCTKLTTITFPHGTTELGSSVLGGCDKLKAVHLPNTIETIEDYVYRSGSTSTTYFGLFENDEGISEITIEEGGSYYSAKDNAVYLLGSDGKESELVYFAPNAKTEELVIPDTVERIRPYALSFYRGYSVTIEPSLTTVKFASNTLANKTDADGKSVPRELTVDTYAFNYASTVTSVTLPEGTTTIGAYAFNYGGLTTFTVPSTVTSIGGAAFYYCKSLSELNFAKGNEEKPLRFEDGSSGIIGYTDVKSITLPERTTYIGKYAFASGSLTEATIPASVTTIAAYAFYSSSSVKLQRVTFADDSKLQTIGDYAFQYSELTEITIPASVESIGAAAFYNCDALKTVTFADNGRLEVLGNSSSNYGVFEGCDVLSSVKFGANSKLRYIWRYTFSGCKLLTTIEFPLSLEQLGDNAFTSTSGIQTITFEEKDGEKSKLHTLGTAFSNTGLTSFTFPETEKEITLPDSLFSGCAALTTVHLSSTVYNVKNAFINGCTSLTSITVSEDNPHYFTQDQFLLYRDSKDAAGGDIVYVFGVLDGPLTIREGAVRILPNALANTALTSISIPASVRTIGDSAFKGCKSLTEVEFAPDSQLVSIGYAAFSGCEALNSINFTNTPVLATFGTTGSYSISSDTFKNCSSLTALDFSKTKLTVFPNTAFDGCEDLASISAPASLQEFNASLSDTKVATLDLSKTALTTIGNYLFRNSASFQSISVPETLTTIGNYAFENCAVLTQFDLSNVTTVGTHAFANCTELANLDLSHLKSIGHGAFNNTGLTKVTLPEKATWEGEYSVYDASDGVFAKCQNLKEVVFPKGIDADTEFTSYMFASCPILDTITFEPDIKLKGLSASMFSGCTSLTSVTLPASFTDFVYSNASYTFSNCTGITRVDLSACASTKLYSSMFSGCTEIAEFLLPSNLTAIPSNAFSGFSKLQAITIPQSVTEIGSSAFARCTSLTELEIPANVTTIGESAFTGCSGIGKINIPSGVTVLESSTFSGCTSLTTVDILASLTSIGTYAFQNCALLEKISLPDTITSIGNYAFQGCTELQSIILPSGIVDTVTSYGYVTAGIGYNAFRNCTSLTTVDLSACTGLHYLESNLFDNCVSLTTIKWPSELTTIGSNCFTGAGLTTLTIPATVTAIASNAFEACPALQTVIFECGSFTRSSSSTSLPVELFLNCTALQTVTFKNGGLQAIGEGWFSGCSDLATVTLPATVTTLNDYAFLDCTSLDTINVDNVTVIGDDVFAGCTTLLEKEDNWHEGVFYMKGLVINYDDDEIAKQNGVVNIKAGATGIGAHIFRGSTALKELTLPGSFRSIGKNAFENCTALTKVDLSNATGITVIPENAFLNCSSLADVTFPSGLISIGSHAFEGTGLTQIKLPDTVQDILSYAFKNTGLTEITLPKALMNYSSGSGFGDGVFQGCVNLTKADFSNAEDVTIVPASTFSGCERLTDLTLPAKLTKLGSSSLEGTGITELVDLPNTLVAIGESAFKNCKSLVEIKLPSSVGDFGTSMFMGCEKLATIDLSEIVTLKNIPSNMFNGCALITSFDFLPQGYTIIYASAFAGTGIQGDITIADTVTSIYANAFKDCTGLTSVTLPSGLTYLGEGVFEGCTKLNELNLSQCTGYTSVSDNAFANLSALEDISLPATVTKIGKEAFMGCEALAHIDLPGALTKIGSRAFQGCALLKDVEFPATLQDIGVNAFKGCVGLKSVALSSAMKNYNGYVTSDSNGLALGAFEDCTGLTTVDLTACTNLTYIAKETFKGCTQLQTVKLPEGLVTIGDGAFEGCEQLKLDALPDTVKDIGIGAFKGCTSLTTALDMPTALVDYVPDTRSSSSYLYASTGLAPNAFENCTGIPSVDFTNCALFTSIPKDAFNGCTLLATVTLPDTIVSIGDRAFMNCENLATLNLQNLVALGADAFTGTKVLTVESNWDNGIYYLNKIAVLCKNEEITGNTVTLRAGTVGVAGNLFKDCTNLHSIDLSALPITELPTGLFQGCSGLTSVTLPDTVTTIGAYCFAGCTKLDKIGIPTAVTTLGDAAFMNTAITQIDLSTLTITAIGAETFKDCTQLVSVHLPDSVVTIGDSAFKGCVLLADVTIPKSIKTIGNSAFEGCAKIKAIEFSGSSIVSIGDRAFYGCTDLGSVVFSATYYSSFKTIGASAFENCTSLTGFDLSIFSYISTIGARAFYGCTQLTSIKFDDGYYGGVTIGDECFAHTGLTTFDVSDLSSGTTFGANVFEGVSGLTIRFYDSENWVKNYGIKNSEEFFSSLPEDTVVQFDVKDI